MTTPRGHVHSILPYSTADGPGGRLVLFLQGCNFDCLACQNPDTIDGSDTAGAWMTVTDVLDEIHSVLPFIRGITVSGGEPTLQPDFLEALFRAIRGDEELARLSILVDSNGAAPANVWDRLAPLVDGIKVDLKALDPEMHERLTKHGNAMVLQSIRHLSAIGKLKEVDVLAIPGLNTDDRCVHAAASWIHTVARGVPITLIRYRSDHVRPDAESISEPSRDEMRHLREVMLTSNVMVDVA